MVSQATRWVVGNNTFLTDILILLCFQREEKAFQVETLPKT